MSSDNKKGLFTDGSTAVSPRVTAVPLSDVDTHAPGEASIGTLVQSASAQVSSLVRAEVELAPLSFPLVNGRLRHLQRTETS